MVTAHTGQGDDGLRDLTLVEGAVLVAIKVREAPPEVQAVALEAHVLQKHRHWQCPLCVALKLEKGRWREEGARCLPVQLCKLRRYLRAGSP